MTNTGDTPALVQSWLEREKENASPENIDVPFVITPTLARIDPQKGQTLRIIYSGEPLPQDKESLFWLNVLEVPPEGKADAPSAGMLQFAYRTRIKLMYRPKGLQGKAQQAPEQLRWQLVLDPAGKPVLKASNATAYVVNLGSISFEAGGTAYDAGAGYVLPGQTATFPLQNTAAGLPAGNGKVVFASINDWGGSKPHEARLSP